MEDQKHAITVANKHLLKLARETLKIARHYSDDYGWAQQKAEAIAIIERLTGKRPKS